MTKTCLEKNNIKKLDCSQFNDKKPIGNGGSATVYSATFQGKIYALKSLNNNLCMNEKTFRKFIRELEILSKTCHRNIIKLYGVSIDPGTDNFMMVLQYANDGSLRTYLQTKQDNGLYKISWSKLIQIANDMVNGLKFLHDKKIIHRDLHSKNILINDGWAVISDFGISQEEKVIANTPQSYVNLYQKYYGMTTLSGVTDKVKINILKYVRFPNSLLVFKVWHQFFKRSEIRAKWIIDHFGKAHALFHAIRLGPNFISVSVVQKIIELGGIISRYFVQRLSQIEYNVRNIEQPRRVEKHSAVPWGSNTPLDVFY
ncbi:15566_t:CDS:2 [Dentiscutata erythropus]|uniref:non-specific serine/threonine protein kinase n=1 Tax=Dentiscutata erythropus TaxID=1348616 RepID=A0A9N9GU60_9GLOM|nr:15566_t:CDS:2 [Dentiscutata erythropus]